MLFKRDLRLQYVRQNEMFVLKDERLKSLCGLNYFHLNLFPYILIGIKPMSL